MCDQICPRVETEQFDADAALEVLDSSLTPSALKKLSRSVMDLSTMSEMKELSKSTSNLMTGGITMPKFKKIGKKLKSESKSSLLRSSADSLSTIDVKSEAKKTGHFQKLAINKKIHNFCPILMKLGENDYLMR